MGLFEGKTPSERNKLIAAGVLGLVALVSLYLAFGRSFFGGSTSATPRTSPTPRAATTSGTTGDRALPTVSEQELIYHSTPVLYTPGYASAPDAGRNIFAFYEPPPPCRGAECPTRTPTPPPPLPVPSPPPPPPILVRAPIPLNVYAGGKPFKMMVDGEFFTPEARIYLNGREMPTTFISTQKLATDVSTEMIMNPGQTQIAVRTPDGTLYSNTVALNVNPPPKPTVQYIGMIGRSRYNNDTAYFMGAGTGTTPFGARLNDVVSGQFRLINITPAEVMFEDVNLGFKHRVAITKTAPTGSSGPGFPPAGFPTQGIPGIPPGFQPGVQRPPTARPAEKKEDVDDKDDPPQ